MKRILAFTVAFAFSFSSAANTEKQTLVNQVLSESSIELSIKTMPAQIGQIFGSVPVKPEHAPILQGLAAALVDSINEDQMLTEVNQYLVEHSDEAHLKNALNWLQSPEGKKATQLELLGLSADNQANMMAFMQELQTSPLPQERLNLVVAIVENMELTEMMPDLMQEVMPVIINSFPADIIPIEKRPTKEQLQASSAQMRKQMAAMKPMMIQGLSSAMAYTYKDLSNEELKAYGDFIGSESGRHYIKTLMKASIKASTSFIGEFIPRMVAEFQQVKQ